MNKERVLDPKNAHIYCVALAQLHRIGKHPDMVEAGYLGNILSVENITEKIGSLDPVDWYKGESFEGEKNAFSDLPEIDRQKVTAVLTDLVTEPFSQEDLRQKFIACHHLANEFGDKILENKKYPVIAN